MTKLSKTLTKCPSLRTFWPKSNESEIPAKIGLLDAKNNAISLKKSEEN